MISEAQLLVPHMELLATHLHGAWHGSGSVGGGGSALLQATEVTRVASWVSSNGGST